MIRKYAEIFCWKNVSSFCSAKATHIFSAKNIKILYIESAKTVNEKTLNELVKLTTLWTTGPWRCVSVYCIITCNHDYITHITYVSILLHTKFGLFSVSFCRFQRFPFLFGSYFMVRLRWGAEDIENSECFLDVFFFVVVFVAVVIFLCIRNCEIDNALLFKFLLW